MPTSFDAIVLGSAFVGATTRRRLAE